MSPDPPEPPSIVSDRLYGLILTSPRLKRQLLPQGLAVSPYTVLEYHQTLVLENGRGTVARFKRSQRIQFQQQGVEAILDHFWGDGVALTEYTTTAGRVSDSLRDQHRRHLVVQLKRPMGKGEILDFAIERTAMEAFTQDEEWEETTVDHPIRQLRRTIIFPKDRPCQTARLIYQGVPFPIHVMETRDDRTMLSVQIPGPTANTPYVIRWRW